MLPADFKQHYGAGPMRNVLTALQVERLLAPHGPYGRVLRPSDGKIPESIAYVQCAGSRDMSKGVRYCSRVCCMYAIKQAMLLAGALPLADVTIYHMDIRAFGKGFEQFYQNAKAMGIEFAKGKVARIEEDDEDNPVVRVEMLEEDGRVEERRHDMVVLSLGLQPAWDPRQAGLAAPDEDGFLRCAPSAFASARTFEEGVFVAGAAAGPKDIPDAVVEAGAAALDTSPIDKGSQAARATSGMEEPRLGVLVSRHFSAMCSQAGQSMLVDDIQQRNLNRIVVAACSPSLHEHTFRAAVARTGLNPYLYEPVNLREQVSWCTRSDPEAATDKALRLVAAGIAKARRLEPLSAISIKAVRHVTVVGGGVTGLRTASDLSRLGLSVTLLERSPFLGGRITQWYQVYPGDHSARELLKPLADQVASDPNITTVTRAEIVAASGCVGNFHLRVRVQPRGVIHLEPAEIDAALKACPVCVPDEHAGGFSERKAIYRPSPASVPALPAIDWNACTRCGECVAAVGGRGISLDSSNGCSIPRGRFRAAWSSRAGRYGTYA